MTPVDHRKDFPMLSKTMHGNPLVYLDSAATAQKPQVVIDTLNDFYANHYATVHRAIYQLASYATRGLKLPAPRHSTTSMPKGKRRSSSPVVQRSRSTSWPIHSARHSLSPVMKLFYRPFNITPILFPGRSCAKIEEQ